MREFCRDCGDLFIGLNVMITNYKFVTYICKNGLHVHELWPVFLNFAHPV